MELRINRVWINRSRPVILINQKNTGHKVDAQQIMGKGIFRSEHIAMFTARKRSLRSLCFYTCLSVILFTGMGWGGVGRSASVHAGIPPWTRHPTGPDTPQTRHSPGTRYPQSTPQDQAPPRSRPPLRSACLEIWSTSGRYASYWNAILLYCNFTLLLSFYSNLEKFPFSLLE